MIAADITGADSGALKSTPIWVKHIKVCGLANESPRPCLCIHSQVAKERGITMVEIKRNATTMENPSATVAEAVEELKGRLFYIQNQAGKYFFTNQANLNYLLLVRMENIHEPEITSLGGKTAP